MAVTKDVNGDDLGFSIYMDGYHKQFLKESKMMVEDDWDAVFMVCGMEGSGKSTFALMSSLYLNSDFGLDNIVFDKAQFEEAVETLPPGSPVVWDEADKLSAHHADKQKKAVQNKFKRIRDKNLYIWLVSPDVWKFGKYFWMHRTKALIEVYAKGKEDGLKRGYWRFWNGERMTQLYIDGKKYHDLDAVPCFRHGKFSDAWNKDGFPISKDDYDEKKAEATKRMSEESKSNKVVVKEKRREYLANMVNNGWDLKRKEFANVFDVTPTTISRDFSHLNDEGIIES